MHYAGKFKLLLLMSGILGLKHRVDKTKKRREVMEESEMVIFDCVHNLLTRAGIQPDEVSWLGERPFHPGQLKITSYNLLATKMATFVEGYYCFNSPEQRLR